MVRGSFSLPSSQALQGKQSEWDDQVPNRSLMMFPSFMNSSYSEGL
jgi:hypothetical protein